MTTFQILEEIRALYALMVECDENGELLHNEDDLKDFVREIKQNKEVKLNSMQDLKIELQHSINAYDEKIKKLSARKQALSNDIDRIKNLQLMLLDGEKCKTDEYNFTFTNTESVKVPDTCDNSYPKEWIVTKYQFDKKAIKEALKSGIDYSEYGVEILKNKSLVIR